jgi:hypothetical protein
MFVMDYSDNVNQNDSDYFCSEKKMDINLVYGSRIHVMKLMLLSFNTDDDTYSLLLSL